MFSACQKNAVIDSLQEQVNNAKDKLLRLMSVGHLPDEGEMDSSTTNLNSCSTQTTVVPLEPPPSPLRDSDTSPPTVLSPPPYIPPPSLPSEPVLVSLSRTQPGNLVAGDSAPSVPSPPLSPRSPEGASLSSQAGHWRLECMGFTSERNTEELQQKLNTSVDTRSESVGSGPSVEVNKRLNSLDIQNKLQDSAPCALTIPPHGDAGGAVVESPVSPGVTGAGRLGFVSNEQLQEILQDLSVDAVISSHRSPGGARRPSNPARDDLNALITFPPLSPLSPRSPLHFYLPSISPYMMRKRRPPFHTSRAGPPPYYYPGSAPPGCRRGSAPPGQERLREPDLKTASTHFAQQPESNTDQSRAHEEDEGEAAGQHETNDHSRLGRRGSRRPRRGSCSARRPKSPLMGHMEGTGVADPYSYSDSESSSSEDYCYYHRPYCEACLHNPYACSGSSTSDTSDSEFEDLYHSPHPVVNFKEDLKPTFV